MTFDRPQSRNEAILQNMLGASNELGRPQSRIEALLMALLEMGVGGGLEIKTYEYTGDGTTRHTINLNDADAKFVLSLRRKDGLVFTNAFSMNATATRVNWTTPNYGEGFIRLSIEGSAITVDGADAGQTLNTDGIDYVVEYLA